MYSGLFEYLEKSPQLQGQRFNFDFIDETRPINYTLSIPTNIPEISTDMLGNKKCQLVFYLTSVNLFGEDIMNNISNLNFFQALRRWFEKQNRNKNYPDLGDGKTATAVFATTDGYIEATAGNVGRYQIQCKVEYTQINQNTKRAPLRF